MKHKFSLMWRVAVALVLVLSFSLVVAVPVSAAGLLTNVTATPEDATAATATTYTIGFTTATTWDPTKVDMEFAVGFTVSGSPTLVSQNIEATNGTLTSNGQIVTYGLHTSTVISAGTAITIEFSGITNPDLPATYSPGVTVTTKKVDVTIDTGIADVTITAKPVKNINTGKTYAAIHLAIEDAATLAGHTITVAAGTYSEWVEVTKSVTLEGAGSSLVTVTTSGKFAVPAFQVKVNNVKISGFTVIATGAASICLYGVSGCTISDNVLAGDYDGIFLAAGSDGNTFTGNEASDQNQGFSIEFSDDNIFTDNIANGNAKYGFYVEDGEGNTFTGNTANLNTRNGFKFVDGEDNTLNYNNIVGNTLEGVKQCGDNLPAVDLDAENNWWGVAVESVIATMVSGLVDYSPWLNAPYPDGEPVTEDFTSVSLYEGWNLISLPLIPDDSDITVVISDDTLASGDVSSVGSVRGYDPATGTFPAYEPGVGGPLTDMEDGYGYWVFMDAADTLTVTGTVMPVGLVVPPSYGVVEGWNLIGFKSVTPMTDCVYVAGIATSGYLLNIAGTYPVLWSYNAETGKYTNVKGIVNGMKVGHGFWLWATEDGTIVPTG